jgi:hypothetical protein
MSDRGYRPPREDPYSPDDETGAGDAFAYRRSFGPPIVSLALIVGVVAGLAGLGLGYKLGLVSPTPTPVPSAAATELPSPTGTPEPDLQADRVSPRLRLAYQAVAPKSWAICDVGTAVVCRALDPSLSVSPAVDHTFGFTIGEMAAHGQPRIELGHTVLVANLGEGVSTGSLLDIDVTNGQGQSRPLEPIDPGRLGIDYFDLGPLDRGTYGLVLGFIPQSGAETSAPLLDCFLASFIVAS